MPSIKVLNIALVLLCIVITAFICTFLAISSSDTALDDTKASRDTSVNSSFTVGEDSVRKRTDEYLDLLMNSTVDYLLQFMEAQRVAIMGIAKEVSGNPWEKMNHLQNYNLARYYWEYQNLLIKGITGFGVNLKNGVLIFYYEETATLFRGPDEYHDIFALVGYGSESPYGGPGKFVYGNVNRSTGGIVGLDSPDTFNWSTPCNRTSGLLTNGTVPSSACFVSSALENLDPLGYYVPIGTTTITPPISFGRFITVNSFMPVVHNGERTGYSFVFSDLRYISKYLQQLTIGGPVDVYPSRSRLYITVRGSWMGSDSIGMLVGATHGEVTRLAAPEYLVYIPPKDSTDPVIRNTAEDAERAQLDFESIAKNQTMAVLNISTDYAPDGEDFYYRVGIMNNGYGLDWYVHIVIDRAYILGEIDRKLEETRVSISDAERKVDDDLKKARTVLYVLVVAVAVLLTVVSIVFVLKIIEPLLILEYEMAMVAVMDLEKVDRERPLSTLVEVRLMQVSFFQMINNLVEYRNYMPASVLQAQTTSDESDRSPTSVVTKTKSNGTESSIMVAQKQNGLQGTEAKMKKVTLLACNMRSFLSEKRDALAMISDYLSTALLHVKTTKGTPDSFSGDRLYVSWNGVKTCSSYRAAAYTFSRELTGPCSGKFSIGIASGQVRCGNMGCDGMKKFTFVGSLASWVHIVERVARMQGADIAVDNTTHEEVTNVAFTRPLLHLSFPKHSDKILLVHEALGTKEVKEEEWMYQMAEGDANDPHTKYKASFKLFMDGDVDGAKGVLEGYTDDSQVTKKYIARMQNAAGDTPTQPYGTSELLLN